MTRANFDPDLCRHMVSLGYNELLAYSFDTMVALELAWCLMVVVSLVPIWSQIINKRFDDVVWSIRSAPTQCNWRNCSWRNSIAIIHDMIDTVAQEYEYHFLITLHIKLSDYSEANMRGQRLGIGGGGQYRMTPGVANDGQWSILYPDIS